MDYLKKEHINFIEPHMCPPNNPDINRVHGLRYLGCSSATSLPPTTIQDSINERLRRLEAVVNKTLNTDIISSVCFAR